MSALRHLYRLLGGRWFRRLFAVRLASQFSDGVFQVALASYALFGQDQTSPGDLALALAVVLLPFSVLGPFAGVMLDRWSRRQVLLWANLVRVGVLLALAGIVAADLPAGVFYAVVLLCLSVNRFLLAGLSASLPHTVVPADLVTANALTPTSGTLAFLLGLGSGGGLRALLGSGDVPVLVAAAVLYAGAGALALRIPRTLLGPDDVPHLPPLRSAFGHVVIGLVAGLRHLASRRIPATGLAVIAGQRYLFGLTTVTVVLLYRNYFNEAAEGEAAFADLGLVTLVGGAGFVAAAFLTPVVVERLDPRRWIVLLLVSAAVVQLLPPLHLTRSSILVASFAVGLAAQGIKICVDTFVQAEVDDAFRGRVFSLYDVIFNVAFVAAAATAALVVPEDGRSPTTLLLVALGYLALALTYAVGSRVPVSQGMS